MTFKQWLKQIDIILLRELGVGWTDLIDQCWRDMYDDEITPKEATQDIINDPMSFI